MHWLVGTTVSRRGCGIAHCVCASQGAGAEAVVRDGDDVDEVQPQDILELWGYITTDQRLRSFAFLGTATNGDGDDAKGSARLVISTTDNQLLEYKLVQGEAEVGHSTPTLAKAIALEVRACRGWRYGSVGPPVGGAAGVRVPGRDQSPAHALL